MFPEIRKQSKEQLPQQLETFDPDETKPFVEALHKQMTLKEWIDEQKKDGKTFKPKQGVHLNSDFTRGKHRWNEYVYEAGNFDDVEELPHKIQSVSSDFANLGSSQSALEKSHKDNAKPTPNKYENITEQKLAHEVKKVSFTHEDEAHYVAIESFLYKNTDIPVESIIKIESDLGTTSIRVLKIENWGEIPRIIGLHEHPSGQKELLNQNMQGLFDEMNSSDKVSIKNASGQTIYTK